MAIKIDFLYPVYNEKVKVSNWSYVNQAYPFDNTNKKGASHYTSFGSTNDVYIPTTTTREAMEMGAHRPSRSQYIRREVVNFTTYPLVEKIIENSTALDNIEIKVELPSFSMYTKDFHKDFKRNEQQFCDIAPVPHSLLNRRPKNEFQHANQHASDKFMDTHFFDIPPNRKCINYLRQIRNASHIF